MTDLAELTRATAALDPPLAVLDLAAAQANLADLAQRAGGTPIRVAAKSVRCRWVLDLALSTPGFAGVMAYSVREAIWLAHNGISDILVGYPTADRGAIGTLAADTAALDAVTLMIDDVDQVRLLPPRVRVCLDIDASLRIGRVHLGVRRSPVRTSAQAAALATAADRAGLRVVGVMFYEAQIAGLADTSPAVRWVKRRSAAELAARRTAVVSAVQNAVGPLELVNSGGTGSVEVSSADPVVTEVTAGSGIYVPTLFNRYRAFRPRPALYFALPVVRRPARGIATLYGGGYLASGPVGKTRMPTPVDPSLSLLGTEGAGEVQTPVQGRDDLRIGDRVWFRPAKAGEQLERFDALHIIENGKIKTTVPTYRGENQNFH